VISTQKLTLIRNLLKVGYMKQQKQEIVYEKSETKTTIMQITKHTQITYLQFWT